MEIAILLYVLRDARILEKLLNICDIGKLVCYEICLKKYIFNTEQVFFYISRRNFN